MRSTMRTASSQTLEVFLNQRALVGAKTGFLEFFGFKAV
jgi:hypothetical protein